MAAMRVNLPNAARKAGPKNQVDQTEIPKIVH